MNSAGVNTVATPGASTCERKLGSIPLTVDEDRRQDRDIAGVLALLDEGALPIGDIAEVTPRDTRSG